MTYCAEVEGGTYKLKRFDDRDRVRSQLLRGFAFMRPGHDNIELGNPATTMKPPQVIRVRGEFVRFGLMN